jgi:hypothetical protein
VRFSPCSRLGTEEPLLLTRAPREASALAETEHMAVVEALFVRSTRRTGSP